MKNLKAMKEQLQQYLAVLLNDKATLSWKIDKDQKFIVQMYHELGTQQFLHYKESIEQHQKELKETLDKISKTKQRLEKYEKN